MLKEITLPDGYSGTLSQENQVISQINEALREIDYKMSNIPDDAMSFNEYIADFEKYDIDVFFSDNKKKATISIENDFITIKINGNTIMVDSDGNVV